MSPGYKLAFSCGYRVICHSAAFIATMQAPCTIVTCVL